MSLLRSLLQLNGPAVARTEVLHPFTVGGDVIDVLVRRHSRASRIKLSIDAARGIPVLTMPDFAAEREGREFVARNARWLAEALSRIPENRPFAHDCVIPVQGADVRIDHRPDERGVTRIEGDLLIVTGDRAHTARRVTDFLKRMARTEISTLVREKAALLNRTPGRITIRDTRTRWGSCSAKGDLSFSWRLILAPADVLDYVVSHEAAHLVRMDHSPAFWRTVATLHPDYEGRRRWLNENGNRLHRIG